MPQEIELKLSLHPGDIRQLISHPLFQQQNITDQGSRLLRNTYYDTPDQSLRRQRVALRVRQKGDQYIQTLKGGGQVLGGIHARQEWEWPLVSEQLDLSLLAQTSFSQLLPDDNLDQQLLPVFKTDFQRHTWLLQDQSGSELFRVELALDQGEVCSPAAKAGRSDPICELELELLQGDPVRLIELALQLARQVPLLINDVSKAQRGYRLLAGTADTGLTTTPLTGDLTHDLQHRLSHWSRLLEAWQFNRQPELAGAALAALTEIKALLPPDVPAEVSILLDELLQRLQPDPVKALDGLLRETAAGLFSLLLMQWLYQAERAGS